jgi:single-strand DNA-binding protein
MAVVSGRLQIRSWTDKEGNKRRTAEVVADNVYFGDSKTDGGNQASGSAYPQTEALLQSYGVPPVNDEYSMLSGDDNGLPF